ncbi:hypothetical protein [Terriglobus sp.]|uniref:hypothetical protein n=1 Tax=Terriglobus sp. TaxID=1889013 RepID=UPI003AFFEC79
MKAYMGGPGSQGRMAVALVVIAGAALGVWLTMDPGKYRTLSWVVLGFFAFRVLIGRMRQQNTERTQMDRG